AALAQKLPRARIVAGCDVRHGFANAVAFIFSKLRNLRPENLYALVLPDGRANREGRAHCKRRQKGPCDAAGTPSGPELSFDWLHDAAASDARTLPGHVERPDARFFISAASSASGDSTMASQASSGRTSRDSIVRRHNAVFRSAPGAGAYVAASSNPLEPASGECGDPPPNSVNASSSM